MSAFIDILKANHSELMKAYGHRLSPDMYQAIYDMSRCRTGTLGYSLWHCGHCHHQDSLPLSCGHRACPQCQHSTTSEWLAKQEHKQLPVEHFMVTFTLPTQLRPLALRHPSELYRMMFKVASSVMKDFASRKHGGKSGFTMVLHTHSRKRDLHPHIHIVVPAGYYDAKRRQWHKGEKGYLYNEFALAKVWRARMLEAINKHPLLQLPQARLPDKWVADCRHIGRGPSVWKYLSRYLYRGVLSDKDILCADKTEVTFRYKEGKTQQWKNRTLPTVKFLWLILQHVLPKGLQRVRDYGLLHGRAKQLRLRILALLIQMGMKVSYSPKPQPAIHKCSRCEKEMFYIDYIRPDRPSWPKGDNPISIMATTV